MAEYDDRQPGAVRMVNCVYCFDTGFRRDTHGLSGEPLPCTHCDMVEQLPVIPPHPRTCLCEACEAARRLMRTLPGRKPVKCHACMDKGWESHPSQSDPTAPYVGCPLCAKGEALQATLIPRSMNTPYITKEKKMKDQDPWKHRSAGMTCHTCMWNVAKKVAQPASQSNPTAEPQVVLGRCRRHAPTMNGYPVVFPNDWCGDHKLDETKI